MKLITQINTAFERAMNTIRCLQCSRNDGATNSVPGTNSIVCPTLPRKKNPMNLGSRKKISILTNETAFHNTCVQISARVSKWREANIGELVFFFRDGIMFFIFLFVD